MICYHEVRVVDIIFMNTATSASASSIHLFFFHIIIIFCIIFIIQSHF